MECPICMENIDGTKNCVTTECGHCFHTNCLMRNVAFNGFGCPYCRFEMVEEELSDSDDEDYEDGEEDNGSDDEEEEDDAGSDLEDFIVPDADANGEKEPLPSFELLEKKLIEKGITYECLVKAFIRNSLYYIYHDDHPGYEDFKNCDEKVEEIMLNTIHNYNLEQEEEVNNVKEYNFFFLQNEYKERKYEEALETSIVKSLSLDDIDEDLDDYNYDNFIVNVLKDINVNNCNYLQV